MFMFLAIITILVFFSLVIVAGIHPTPQLVSQYELHRRSSTSKQAKARHRRELLLPNIYAAIEAKIGILLVAFILLCVVTFGWVFGIILAVTGTLLYPVIANWGPTSRLSAGIYHRYEVSYLDLVEKLQPVCY